MALLEFNHNSFAHKKEDDSKLSENRVNAVTESLQHASSIGQRNPPGYKYDEDFNDSGDIPLEAELLLEMQMKKSISAKSISVKKSISVMEKFRGYFLSKKYPLISSVFGTMGAFFLVMSRVERFLHTEGIVPEYFISLDFNEVHTFWFLTGFFVIFIIIDCVAVWSVDGSDHRSRARWLASVINIFIVVFCWFCFWAADMRRCCDQSDATLIDRWLASGNDENSGGNVPALCSCPNFGSRLYDGLGTVEPFTSLIALRLFRSFVAKRVVQNRTHERATPSEMRLHLHDEDVVDPFDVHQDGQHGKNGTHVEHAGGNHDDHGHTPRGTAAELWVSAISKHPGVAKRFGMISAEILQIMLGLPVPTITEEPLGEKDVMAGQAPTAPPTPKKPVNSKYSTELAISDSSVPQRRSDYMFHAVGNSAAAPSSNMDQPQFVAPNARLARSMRRCDRKLLPIFDNGLLLTLS
jgi:hypothetical protein